MNAMKTPKILIIVLTLVLLAFSIFNPVQAQRTNLQATTASTISATIPATVRATIPVTAQATTVATASATLATTLSATVPATLTATAAATTQAIDERINVRVDGLFPEGVEYDAKNNRFLVSSTSKGTVYAIAANGVTTPFIEDARLPSSLGLEVDATNNRLFVVAHNYQKKAFLGIYDLTTGKNIAFVDLAPLTPKAPKRFPNDVAVDANGIAYVTDSWTGVIYRVTPQGQATIFLQDDRFSTDFALNGIAYYKAGNYLLAVLKPGLIKIPLTNPKALTEVALDQPLGNEDGIVFLDDKTLVVVVNQQGKVYRIESDDDFSTAKVTGTFETGNVFPTTAAVRDGVAYVLYTYNNQEKELISLFPIQKVMFNAVK
jgi:sugar lactone lactonase YvrE